MLAAKGDCFPEEGIDTMVEASRPTEDAALPVTEEALGDGADGDVLAGPGGQAQAVHRRDSGTRAVGLDDSRARRRLTEGIRTMSYRTHVEVCQWL